MEKTIILQNGQRDLMFNRGLKWEKIVLAKKAAAVEDALVKENAVGEEDKGAEDVGAIRADRVKDDAIEDEESAGPADKEAVDVEHAKVSDADGPEEDNYFFASIIYNGKKEKSS